MASFLPQASAARREFEDENDRVVRAEIDAFRQAIDAYLRGELTDEQFRPIRLKQGVYGQRQPGVQMLRIKIPGGLMTAAQAVQLARIADEYAGGKCHATTRQNIQFHYVQLRDVPAIMQLMADCGLTNREACFNTVRNVTVCSWAGLAHDEVFDVRPYAQRLAFAFLRKELTTNLPRKFKIAFDGCAGKDCIAGAINDVGLRAQIRDGVRGFRMTVAGGLGALPREAHLLSEFVPADQLLARCEAVIRVFNKYGNRSNKNLARLKFVLRDRGLPWFLEQVEAAYSDILTNGGIAWPETVPEGFGGFESSPRPLAAGDQLPIAGAAPSGDPAYDAWRATNVVAQRQTGYASAIVRLNQGNLTSAQLRALAALTESAADGLLRVSIEQNLMLAFVPLAALPGVHRCLTDAGLAAAGAQTIEDITTCPGASTCNLGITKAMSLGAALQQTVRNYADERVRKLSIKISGCPNSCGQHWISDFGFYGNARKIEGREVPYYQMLLGGGHDQSGVVRYGLAIQSVPARLAPQALARVVEHFVANRLENESFRDYVLRYKVETFRELTSSFAKPAELFPELYQDWGDEVTFSRDLGRS
jgi:sulfite reductase beta subunit-like hemoprotein